MASGMLKAPEILATLKSLGKPQTATIYKRHGSGDDVYGTLTSDIAKLQKKIKRDHALSQALWRSGNAEARILALLIADPARVSQADAESLIVDGPAHFLACYLSELLARSPDANAVMRAWTRASDEDRLETGYGILASRLKNDASAISDADAEAMLETIEREIQASPNWARYAMNSAVIAIGVFKPHLSTRAVEAAKRIGDIGIDHGDTTCKTPDAVSYIKKAGKRKPCP